MSVQRAQHEITSSEFLDWIVFLDDDPNRFHRQDYYLAQIAAEIRRTLVKEPEKVKTNHFLMKFSTKRVKKKKKRTREEVSKKMKAFFSSVLGKK